MNFTYQELAEAAEPLIKLLDKNSDILYLSIDREEIKVFLNAGSSVENFTVDFTVTDDI